MVKNSYTSILGNYSQARLHYSGLYFYKLSSRTRIINILPIKGPSE